VPGVQEQQNHRDLNRCSQSDGKRRGHTACERYTCTECGATGDTDELVFEDDEHTAAQSLAMVEWRRHVI